MSYFVGVLQCVAMRCSLLQRVAVRCSAMQCVVVACSVCCSVSQWRRPLKGLNS